MGHIKMNNNNNISKWEPNSWSLWENQRRIWCALKLYVHVILDAKYKIDGKQNLDYDCLQVRDNP